MQLPPSPCSIPPEYKFSVTFLMRLSPVQLSTHWWNGRGSTDWSVSASRDENMHGSLACRDTATYFNSKFLFWTNLRNCFLCEKLFTFHSHTATRSGDEAISIFTYQYCKQSKNRIETTTNVDKTTPWLLVIHYTSFSPKLQILSSLPTPSSWLPMHWLYKVR